MRSLIFCMRLTAAEKRRLEEAAWSYGFKNVGSFVRQAALILAERDYWELVMAFRRQEEHERLEAI